MKSILFRFAFICITLVLFTSCTKTQKSGGLQQLDNFYTQVTIDGTSLEFTENEKGFVNGYGKAGVWVDGMSQWFERQSTTYARNGENIFNIYFMKFVNSNPPGKEEIKGIFHQGNYTYGSSDFNNLVNGVEIRYIDESGMEWTTKGNQSGSTFEVTEHSANSVDSHTPYMTTGKFTCKLYNNQGAEKTITAGKFSGRTVVYY